ncbi:MAG: ABC transporter permease [Chloroflexota bacterium]|nr:MAG: peptide ABC transporter permease [Chloroflexota bacterium]
MRLLLRRLGFYLVALWAAITVNFLLPRLLPGNPIDYFLARYQSQLAANPHLLDSLRPAFDFKRQSLLSEYWQYLQHLVRLDFGVSYSQFPTPVNTLVGQALPWSLFLAGVSAVLAFTIGTLLGIVAAWRRGSAVDVVVTPLTMFTQSFPAFFVAMLVLYFIGVTAGWFPINHAYGDSVQPGLNFSFIVDVFRHAAMPIVALLLSSIGGWLLGMRSVMINTLSEDYIAMAQAKGLSNRRVMMMYAARNALLPQVTSFAIVLGYAVTSLVLIENVFAYPGLGYLMVTAVQATDYPLMQAIFFILTVGMLAANLIADLAYALLDPRAAAS